MHANSSAYPLGFHRTQSEVCEKQNARTDLSEEASGMEGYIVVNTQRTTMDGTMGYSWDKEELRTSYLRMSEIYTAKINMIMKML